MKQKEDVFRGVIPGISLTKEPGSYPWERPPEMEDPDQVIKFYLERMSNEESLEKTLMLIDTEFPIRALVEGTLTAGVSRGLHTIDMSMIVAPVLHEFIKGEAERRGIEYNEGLEDGSTLKKARESYTKAKLKSRLEKVRKEGPKKEVKEISEEVFEEEEKEKVQEKEVMPEEKPKGLMARRK